MPLVLCYFFGGTLLKTLRWGADKTWPKVRAIKPIMVGHFYLTVPYDLEKDGKRQ